MLGRYAWAILIAAMSGGCLAPAGPLPAADDDAARVRMAREFGMTPPIRAVALPGIDDGGSHGFEFIDARGTSLVVAVDMRGIPIPEELTTGWMAASPAARAEIARSVERELTNQFDRRPLFRNAYPGNDGAIRVEIASPAESAIVDLAWAAYGSAITREHLDLLDREDAWVRATDRRGRVQREQILSRRSERETDALRLRAFVLNVERKRTLALTGEPPRTVEDRRQRIRRELDLSYPYALRGAGSYADGGSGFVHVADARGREAWVLVDARIREASPDKSGITWHPPRHVWMNTKSDWEGARPFEYSSEGERAVLDLLTMVLADSSRSRGRVEPHDSWEQLPRIRERIVALPASALVQRENDLENVRLEAIERSRMAAEGRHRAR